MSSTEGKWKIEWAPVALEDLEEIADFIASQDEPHGASRVVERITQRIDSLGQHPNRCRLVPELKVFGIRDYRELIVPPYRVLFRIRGRVVGILGVFDGRRDLEELLILRSLR